MSILLHSIHRVANVSLFSLVQTIFTYSKHAQCYDITEVESTYQLPLPKNIVITNDTSNSTTVIVSDADAEPSDQLGVKLVFESLEEADPAMFCITQSGRKAAFNFYAKEKGGVLPKLSWINVFVPDGAPTPRIHFVQEGRRLGHDDAQVTDSRNKGDEDEEVC
jgi:hypothetical protein